MEEKKSSPFAKSEVKDWTLPSVHSKIEEQKPEVLPAFNDPRSEYKSVEIKPVGHSKPLSAEEIAHNAEIAAILEEHDGLESNIPVTHKYWKMKH